MAVRTAVGGKRVRRTAMGCALGPKARASTRAPGTLASRSPVSTPGRGSLDFSIYFYYIESLYLCVRESDGPTTRPTGLVCFFKSKTRSGEELSLPVKFDPNYFLQTKC